MSYKLLYTLPYVSLKGGKRRVEIEKRDYTGECIELLGSPNTFSVEINDDDFLYVPTRFSTARIGIIGKDYLRNLYSNDYTEHRVTLLEGDRVLWCGFVKPELFTQDYTLPEFALEVECQSALSVLEFIDYKLDGTKDFISFWDLLKMCISSVDARYEAVYIPHVYASSESAYANNENVLAKMNISEQNFFDEEDKPMNLKEVLEEICKFLGWTVCDWKGSLYFVDVDHSGIYKKYNGTLDALIKEELLNTLSIQSIGFMGSDNSLDVLPGYNKASVRANNYKIKEVEVKNDFEDLNIVTASEIVVKNDIFRKAICIPDAEIEIFQYEILGDSLIKLPSNYIETNWYKANEAIGAIPVRYCEYNREGGNFSITSYNYEDYYQVRWMNDFSALTPALKKEIYTMPIFRMTLAAGVFSDGDALVFSASIKISVRQDLGIIGADYQIGGYLLCRMRIGNRYFDGKDWPEISGNIPPFRVKTTTDKKEIKIANTKHLDDPYNGADGFLIVFKEMMAGQLEFEILGSYGDLLVNTYPNNDNVYGIFLKNIELKLVEQDNVKKWNKGGDRIYENVVNEKFVNEADEITLKISSNNFESSQYNNVLLNGEYLENNLYSIIEKQLVRPEELLIRRIVRRYNTTKIKLTQTLSASKAMSPISLLTDITMKDKRFIITGGNIDYASDTFSCKMIEI